MGEDKSTNLTEGSPFKVILKFTIPILLTTFLQQLYSTIDTAVIGRFLGTDALAGAGSTGAVNFLILGFCQGMCFGLAIPIAQSFGAQDMKRLRKTFANSIWVSVFFSIVITVLVCVFCMPILKIMQTPDNVLSYAYDYIFIIFAGIPITIAYNLLSGVIRALGDSRTPLIFLAMASVINIGFDILSVTVLGMGVTGPAYATLLSQLFSVVMCFIYIRKRFTLLQIQKGEWALDASCIKTLFVMGVPMGLQYSITAIGSVILQGGVNTLGSDPMAAVAAASRLNIFLMCPLDALGISMTTYAGQNLGAKKLDRIGEGLKVATIMGLVYSAVVAVAMQFLGRFAMLVFIKATETAVLEQAFLFERINCYFFFLLTFIMTFRYTIQGMGYSGFAVFAGVMEMIARTVVGILLIPAFGYICSCYASPFAWFMGDLFLVPAYFYVRKKIGRALA